VANVGLFYRFFPQKVFFDDFLGEITANYSSYCVLFGCLTTEKHTRRKQGIVTNSEYFCTFVALNLKY
jgi:hypothetical protein